MLFSSISFLYYFLPCVLIMYFIMPRRFKNLWLLLASLFFYGWGGVDFLVLMVIMIGAGYVLGLLIERYTWGTALQTDLSEQAVKKGRRYESKSTRENRSVSFGVKCLGDTQSGVENNRKNTTGQWIFVISIGIFVLTLVYYKFSPVFPIGISFYTFQIMSYLADVYRGEVPAQKNFINFAAYASMFPQLVAGPIVRYADVAKQLESRIHSLDRVALGIRRFIVGLAKKVLIANALGELCDIFRSSNDKAVLFYWVYAAAFMLHIYFDFSGYSDMAVGLGKMFGFDFMDNFNYPYVSKSITEFWRRWHISLSSWFRDYVYIPLGGNRVPKTRWFFNIFVVWFLTGFWHGAAWNFIAWGLGFAVLLVVEKMWLLPMTERMKMHYAGNKAFEKTVQVLSHGYVLVIVCLSFVMFNAKDFGEGLTYFAAMFGAGEMPVTSVETVYYLRSYLVVFVVAMIGATPFPKLCVEKVQNMKFGRQIFDVLEPVVLILLLLAVTAYLVDGSFNPFLYFRF